MEIEYLGVMLTVIYDYTPGEPEQRYYSGGLGYPGTSDEIEIEDILHEGKSIASLLEDHLDSIISIIAENHER